MQGREQKRQGSQSHELLLLRSLGTIRDLLGSIGGGGGGTDYEFQMQYLKDANGTLVWVEVNSVDGVKTYTYYDSPGGSIIVPVQPLQPLSLDTDTELIEDEYIAVVTNAPNGYTAGDVLAKISYFDIATATPILLNSFWFNKTTTTILSTVNVLDLEDQDGPILGTPGVAGITFTSPASTCVAHFFVFDADNLLIENLSNKDVLVTVNGILGNDFVVVKGTSKTINIDVPHMTDVSICGADGSGWTGDVHITYSRSK